MEQSIKKFLEFNGRNIYFTAADGENWIALKPICRSLNIHFEHQRESINGDKFLSQLPRQYRVVAADGKLRKMLCLPEKYIYGWLFSIQSDSEELQQYKGKCYDLLFNYFHGSLSDRMSIVKEKTLTELEIEKLEERIEQLPDVIKLNELKAKAKQANKSLSQHDKALVSSQLPLWSTEVSSNT